MDNPPGTLVLNLAFVLRRSAVARAECSSAVTTPTREVGVALVEKGAEKELILDMAMKRTATKDQGTCPHSPPEASFFLALPLLSDSHLSLAGNDCGVVFNPSFGSSSPLLLLIRAKEAAQAKLAEAIAKRKAEKEKTKA